MINLLDVMVPMRSESHCGVHVPGGVTYPTATSNKVREGTNCVYMRVRAHSCKSAFIIPFFKTQSVFKYPLNLVLSLDI